MPKRSNPFQRLIRRIYDQIKPHGATLTESAAVRERDSETEREVDVLVELKVADSVIRIGIECRDHGRPADIKWIDELIGKYRDLPVDRVVAVSRSGFTRPATRKATSNRIETRTLKEAMESDWPAELLLVGVARFTASLRPTTCEIISVPPWPDSTQPRGVRVQGRNESSDEFMQKVMQQLHHQVLPLMNSRLGKEFDLLSDLDKTHRLQAVLEVPETEFISAVGTAHRLQQLVLNVELKFEYGLLPVQRRLLGRVGVTLADDDKATEPVTLMVAQEPGEPLGRPVIFRRDSDDEL